MKTFSFYILIIVLTTTSCKDKKILTLLENTHWKVVTHSLSKNDYHLYDPITEKFYERNSKIFFSKNKIEFASFINLNPYTIMGRIPYKMTQDKLEMFIPNTKIQMKFNFINKGDTTLILTNINNINQEIILKKVSVKKQKIEDFQFIKLTEEPSCNSMNECFTDVVTIYKDRKMIIQSKSKLNNNILPLKEFQLEEEYFNFIIHQLEEVIPTLIHNTYEDKTYHRSVYHLTIKWKEKVKKVKIEGLSTIPIQSKFFIKNLQAIKINKLLVKN